MVAVYKTLIFGAMLICFYVLGGFFTSYYKYQKAKSRTLKLEVNNQNRYAKNSPHLNSSSDN